MNLTRQVVLVPLVDPKLPLEFGVASDHLIPGGPHGLEFLADFEHATISRRGDLRDQGGLAGHEGCPECFHEVPVRADRLLGDVDAALLALLGEHADHITEDVSDHRVRGGRDLQRLTMHAAWTAGEDADLLLSEARALLLEVDLQVVFDAPGEHLQTVDACGEDRPLHARDASQCVAVDQRGEVLVIRVADTQVPLEPPAPQ